MKNFTLTTVNTVNEKCAYSSCVLEKFSESINLRPLPLRNWSTTLVLVKVRVVIQVNKTFPNIPKLKVLPKVYCLFINKFFFKIGADSHKIFLFKQNSFHQPTNANN